MGLGGNLTVSSKFSLEKLLRRFNRGEVRRDNDLQRSPQWKQGQKDFLITTALQEWKVDPLKICEEIFEDGSSVLWLIDGGNRLTAWEEYKNNMFAIGRNTLASTVEYRAARKDKDGNFVKDENGRFVYDNIEYNAAGKKYKDLPEELKDRFDNYEIYVDEYYGCTKEDIKIHIQRFNMETPMNTIQKATTHMGDAATWMKRITKKENNCRFFYEFDNYSPTERRNGTLDRIVAESIMLIYHPDNWKKSQEKIGDYLCESASESEYETLRTYFDRIYELECINPNIVSVFVAKNTFIWLTLFDKFTKLGLDDSKFADFINAFKENELFNKEIDGTTFATIDNDRSTKDKRVIFGKLNILETLMMDFLSINKEDILESFDTTEKFDTYASKFLNSELISAIGCPMGSDVDRIAAQTLMASCGKEDFSDKAIQEFISADEYTEDDIDDLQIYLDQLNEWSLDVPAGTSLLKAKYVPAMVGLIKYTYDNETDDEALEWFKDYAAKCTKPESDVLKLMNDMKSDLDAFLAYKDSKTA